MSGTDYNRGDRDFVDNETRVPLAEERLEVDKRQAELGEVRLRKTVTEEQQTVPVELEREEVHVSQQNVADRPVRPGEDVFQEGTITVPVRGEEAVVHKKAYVTGEVELEKTRTTERQNVSDTVRRERVEVDEDYDRHRNDFQQHFTGRQSSLREGQFANRTWEDAEPNYQYGYSASRNQQYQGREFDDIEPDLRRDYETRYAGSGRSGGSGDSWQHLREEIREGWNRGRR